MWFQDKKLRIPTVIKAMICFNFSKNTDEVNVNFKYTNHSGNPPPPYIYRVKIFVKSQKGGSRFSCKNGG